MFNVNDYVVYQYWVCKISDIKKLDYSDMGFEKDVTYYIMSSVYEKETFFIPVTHEDSLRKPLTREEALDLIDNLNSVEPISHLNDEEYRNIIHNYDCYSYAKIVKGIYAKNKYISSVGKKLSNVDGKYFHLAEKYLHDELAFALGIKSNEVEQYIKDRLESAEEHISA
jgi:CarD family transcriptional regulator